MSVLRGLYIHIPFCPQICPYCAFASLRGRDHLHEPYMAALRLELERWAEMRPPLPLDTVFIGGGTPTQIAPALLADLIEAVDAVLGVGDRAEITIEANPGTVDEKAFADLRAAGCTRLSLGVQSFDDGALKRLGRVHSAADAERAFERARRAGFDNVSIDLIFSVPGVGREVWQSSVVRAIDLGPEHISAYALTIEEGTTFAQRQRDGRLIALGEDEDAEQYEWTRRRLIEAGFDQYEVSNFARGGFHSRHNWGYWTGVEYLGLGLSSHSYLGGERFWNTREIDAYIDRLKGGLSPIVGSERVDEQTARRERFWLGLRTSQGVALSVDESALLASSMRFGQLVGAGYLAVVGGYLSLEEAGWSLADLLAVEVTDILEEAPLCRAATSQENGIRGY